MLAGLLSLCNATLNMRQAEATQRYAYRKWQETQRYYVGPWTFDGSGRRQPRLRRVRDLTPRGADK